MAHLTPSYFSSDSVVGGGERYVYYLAQSLRAAAPDIQQCVFAVGVDERQFERDGISVRVLRNESSMADPRDGFSGALWEELRDFDLVHVHQCLTLFAAYSIAIVRSLGIPAVGTDLGGGDQPLLLTKRCLDLLDGLVSISRYAHDTITGAFNGPHEVLVGPVDTSYFSPLPGVVRDPRMVLCVGRIVQHKGIDRVIAALPPQLRLVVAGTVYHPSYYDRIRAMAVGKNVEFVHDADDARLLQLYRSAGLFVQASTAKDIYGNIISKPELMGLTTLEALACGLPVAVSATGSLPELITDARFGRVFQGEDELEGILREFACGAWPAHDLGPVTHAHVAASHGMETIGRRLTVFYGTVLAQAQRPD